MLNQLFEDFSKASESSLQLQQEMLRAWTRQWSAGPQSMGLSTEMARNLEKRWSEIVIEMLNKHKEALESAYAAGIEAVEKTFRLTEAKSSEEYQRIVEDLWRQSLKSTLDRTEAQMQDFRQMVEKSFEMAQKAAA